MDLIGAVGVAARAQISALAADVVRLVGLRAAVGILALVALGFLAAAATIALAVQIGLVWALTAVGALFAAIALIIYLAARRKSGPLPAQTNTFAPSVIRQDLTIDPKPPAGIMLLALVATAGYILAQRTGTAVPRR